MAEHIRVALVDDHPLFREGVAHSLRARPDIEIVGEGTCAEDAVRLACDLLPDVILLDIAMPGGGIKAAHQIAMTCPVSKIVMLTVSEDEDDVVAALKAGARAYALKGVSAGELVEIIRAVSRGEAYVTPSLAAGLLVGLAHGSADARAGPNPLDELSQREHQILERVAAGASNKEIGHDLALSEKTVKHYMTNILQKLQVRNRVEAALLAQKAARMERRAP